MNGELAIQQLKSMFLSLLRAHLQNGVALKLDGLIAAHAHEVMVMMGIGLVQFIMLVPFRQFQFSEDTQTGEQFDRTIHRGEADASIHFEQFVVQIFRT